MFPGGRPSVHHSATTCLVCDLQELRTADFIEVVEAIGVSLWSSFWKDLKTQVQVGENWCPASSVEPHPSDFAD